MSSSCPTTTLPIVSTSTDMSDHFDQERRSPSRDGRYNNTHDNLTTSPSSNVPEAPSPSMRGASPVLPSTEARPGSSHSIASIPRRNFILFPESPRSGVSPTAVLFEGGECPQSVSPFSDELSQGFGTQLRRVSTPTPIQETSDPQSVSVLGQVGGWVSTTTRADWDSGRSKRSLSADGCHAGSSARGFRRPPGPPLTRTFAQQGPAVSPPAYASRPGQRAHSWVTVSPDSRGGITRLVSPATMPDRQDDLISPQTRGSGSGKNCHSKLPRTSTRLTTG